jgi:hypothetical protein
MIACIRVGENVIDVAEIECGGILTIWPEVLVTVRSAASAAENRPV